MMHLNSFFKIKTLGLAVGLTAIALGACASPSKVPTMAEGPAHTAEASTAISEAYGTLVLNVTGYKKQSGQIMVAVYNDEAAFDTEATPLRTDAVTVIAAQTEVIFDDLPSGDYAFKVFHDANGNEKLDTNMFGMPTEAYGFSMNASDPFSAPEFDESKFSLVSGENIRNVSLD